MIIDYMILVEYDHRPCFNDHKLYDFGRVGTLHMHG